MRGRRKRKMEYAPDSLVRHIERTMKEKHFEQRVDAMDYIAEELDRVIRKRRYRKL